jgi:hypothetical protein
MPKREPGHQHSGEPLANVVRLRRDANGRYVPADPKPETVTSLEAAERPPIPDDPRPVAFQQIPPFGGAA